VPSIWCQVGRSNPKSWGVSLGLLGIRNWSETAFDNRSITVCGPRLRTFADKAVTWPTTWSLPRSSKPLSIWNRRESDWQSQARSLTAKRSRTTGPLTSDCQQRTTQFAARKRTCISVMRPSREFRRCLPPDCSRPLQLYDVPVPSLFRTARLLPCRVPRTSAHTYRT